MNEYLPLLIMGAVIGVITIAFIVVYKMFGKINPEDDFERNMADGEIIKRLLVYIKPYYKTFIVVFIIMLFSIVYELVSPLITGKLIALIQEDFELPQLFTIVAMYVGILIVSLICTYFQAMILQKIGQKILSDIREDVFTHIEKLSHEQLNNIPVGKLVTRVSNDPNAISYMFTNILVTLIKNIMVMFGVLGAMLLLNYTLTLMILCLMPFVCLFTFVFRVFSRKVHRAVSNATTALNTYLSENLSGIKITQIFNQEDRKMSDFLEKSDNQAKAKHNRMYVFGIFRPMIYMLNVVAILCLFYLGSKASITGATWFVQTIDASIIVSFYLYISRFFNPIQTLAEQFDMLQRSFASAEKIFTIMDLVPDVVDGDETIELEDIKGI